MTLSFEFFPPRNMSNQSKLVDTITNFAVFDPSYMTVTYGAGGSTKEGTRSTLAQVAGRTDAPLASHLTFLSTSKPDLHSYIDSLWDMGVKHIVALRGDLPEGTQFEDFIEDHYYDYTSNFVEAILKRHPFEISVAAYPQKHPDAPSLDADIEALCKKCDAGAARAITQFFFDNNVYYDFMDKCTAKNITTPICPGLVPVHDINALGRFASKCGLALPKRMIDRFEPLKDNPEEHRKAAVETLYEQAADLKERGIDHLHFFTMNKFDITADVCRMLDFHSETNPKETK